MCNAFIQGLLIWAGAFVVYLVVDIWRLNRRSR